jgi:hypothetical protein
MCCEICQLLERLNLTDSKEAQSLFVCTCKQQRREQSTRPMVLAKAA